MEYNSDDSSPIAAERTNMDSVHSIEQVELDEVVEHAPPPLVELTLTAHKGLGLFATQDIKRGTRILAEAPLVALPPAYKNTLNIEEEFAKLTPDQLNVFCELHHEKIHHEAAVRAIVRRRLSTSKQYSGRALDLAVDDEMKMRSIFTTNVVQMGSRGQFGSGVFPLYSRINHSCTPNVHNSYNATIGKEVIHTVCEIAKGEEILTSYIHTLRTRKQRKELLEPYGFECDCEACKGPRAAEHEARRQRLFDIDQGFAIWAKRSNLLVLMSEGPVPKSEAQALMWAGELVDLLKKEGLVGMDLAMAYRECSRFSLKLGLMDRATAFALKEQEVEHCCNGDEITHLASDMEAAEFWLKHIEETAEKEKVKINMNRKRVAKEEKKADKKAAKKAGKGKR